MKHLPDFSTPGRRIRTLRESQRMTQLTLGMRIARPGEPAVSQPIVSQWEHDLWRPNQHMQHAIADALGVSRSWLFEEPSERVA